MASMFKKTMVYLGLGPDEEYEDYDAVEEPPSARPERPRPQPQARQQRPRPQRPAPRAVASDRPETSGTVRTLGPPARPQVAREAPQPRQSAVRAIPTPASKPHVVSPTSFNEVQEIADRFKSTNPVIVNLQGANRDLSRRLIDFASGLCYGLGGQMERVADQVYLLTPTNVEVSAEERRRLEERGFVDR